MEHRFITDPDIHEPKGCASAQGNTVYVANGGGSGDWTNTVLLGEIFVKDDFVLPLVEASDLQLEEPSQYTKFNVLNVWNTGMSRGVTLDAYNGSIQISKSGIYEISFFVCHSIGGTVDKDLAFKYAINGNLSQRKVRTTSLINNQKLISSASGLAFLNAGDIVDIYVACSATIDLLVSDASLSVKGFIS
jgi:hypothetical protein